MVQRSKLACAVLGLLGLAWASDAEAGRVGVGVTSTGNLVAFDTDTPGSLFVNRPITGLGSGVSILGIDLRPASPNKIYALASDDRLYTIDGTTGAATALTAAAGSASASAYGFGFNPVIDRIRIVGSDTSNRVGNPDTGAIAPFTNVFYNAGDANEGATPNVVHHAYTNSFAGASATQLYAIDTKLNILTKQANNLGTLDTVGSLGVSVSGDGGGFDIVGADEAYAVLDVGNTSQLYSLNLTTGAATGRGGVGGDGLVAFAVADDRVAVVPLPAGVWAALPVLAIAGWVQFRRKAQLA